MCNKKANLVNRLITDNVQSFTLKGMVCPTFQNEGTADVVIDGRLVKPKSTFGVYAPGYELQNSVNIQFLGEKGSTTRLLYLSFLEETN